MKRNIVTIILSIMATIFFIVFRYTGNIMYIMIICFIIFLGTEL